MGRAMNVKLYEFQTRFPEDTKEECVWKVVMKNNLGGEGTSFDPTNLTMTACRCITCDGYAGDCRSYSA